MKKTYLHALQLLLTVVLSISSLSAKESVLQIGSSDISPYSSKHNPRKGYINEVVLTAFKKLGVEYRLQYFPHARMVHLLENADLHSAFPVRKFSHDSNKFLYSTPLPGGEAGLLVKTGKPAVQGKGSRLIGVIRNESIPPQLLQNHRFEFFHANSHIQLLELLSKDRLDAVFIDRYTVGELIIAQLPELIGKVKFEQTYQYDSPFYFAVSKRSKGAQAFVEGFNAVIAEMEKSGEIQQVLHRYGIYQKRNPSPGKLKELLIAAPNINSIDFLKLRAQSYLKSHKNIRLNWRVMEESVLRKRMLGDFALSHNEFDIAFVGPYEVQNWAGLNWFQPFGRLEKDYDLEDLLPLHQSKIQFQEQIYALPVLAETSVMYYRKDILEKLDIELPEHVSYEQLETILAKVHRSEPYVSGIGLRTRPGWGQNIALISTMAQTFGANWNIKNLNLNSPQWQEAITTYYRLVTMYGPTEIEDLGWQENQTLFEQGKLAFFIDSSSFASRFQNSESSLVRDKFAITDVPSFSGNAGVRWVWSWNLAIPKDAPNSSQARELAQWMTSKEGLDLSQNSEGYQRYAWPLANRKSTYNNQWQDKRFAYIQKELNLLNNAPLEQFNSHVSSQFLNLSYFPSIGDILGLEIYNGLIHQKPVASVLKQAQQKIDRLQHKINADK